MIKIFDSMSKTKKELATDKNVSLYLCGPTVYNYVHIGNVRPVLVMDVLHRLLIHLGYTVNYVHNVTDIDDKIIHQAEKELTTEDKISEKYLAAYQKDLKVLNVLSPTKMPKVTDFIPEIIEFIKELVSKKTAYVTDSDVYFQVDKISSYGQLSNNKLEELISNVRIENKTNKISEFDFALWKNTSVGLKWESPWGQGRPGWHTECAAFINKLFNHKTINLHSGGIDLIFPHHENERAQILADSKKELANIWWHVGHVNLKSEKMSKSLNNVILVKDFYQKYHSFILRYLLLNHDHQQPINFTDELVTEAVSVIKRYQTFLQIWSYYSFVYQIQEQEIEYDKNFYPLIIESFNDNINTVKIFTILSNIITFLYKEVVNKNSKENFNNKDYQSVFKTLLFAFETLGFNFEFGNYSEEIKVKIKKWNELKANKNFENADLIREELQNLGVLPKN